ncbi:MAG: hypothetical protein ACXQS2_06090 [Methermicoccaceae archaeon]
MSEEEREEAWSDGSEGSTVGYRLPGNEEESPKFDEEPDKEASEEEDEGGEEVSEEDEDDELGDEEEEDEEALPKVSKELEKERKQLLKTYTQKMQELSRVRLKANLVDAIERDPERTLRYLADRFGVSLGEEKKKEEEEIKFPDLGQVQPKKDEDFATYLQRLMATGFSSIPDIVRQAVKKELKPMTSGHSETRAAEERIYGTINYLNSKYKDWGMYEDVMADLVMKHPTLADDPDELYKMAKMLGGAKRDRSRATKESAKSKKGKMKRGSGKVKVSGPKGKLYSFDEAWERAKHDLKAR